MFDLFLVTYVELKFLTRTVDDVSLVDGPIVRPAVPLTLHTISVVKWDEVPVVVDNVPLQEYLGSVRSTVNIGQSSLPSYPSY